MSLSASSPSTSPSPTPTPDSDSDSDADPDSDPDPDPLFRGILDGLREAPLEADAEGADALPAGAAAGLIDGARVLETSAVS